MADLDSDIEDECQFQSISSLEQATQRLSDSDLAMHDASEAPLDNPHAAGLPPGTDSATDNVLPARTVTTPTLDVNDEPGSSAYKSIPPSSPITAAGDVPLATDNVPGSALMNELPQIAGGKKRSGQPSFDETPPLIKTAKTTLAGDVSHSRQPRRRQKPPRNESMSP